MSDENKLTAEILSESFLNRAAELRTAVITVAEEKEKAEVRFKELGIEVHSDSTPE
jgi:hypothetical protein